MIQLMAEEYGRTARNRLSEASSPGVDGARAALESFYFAFNQGSLDVLRQVWANDALVQLNNPLGGVLRGRQAIEELYARVFHGPARVWVEFYEIVEYGSADTVIFAGRERGEYARNDKVLPLAIRTTRVFGYTGPAGWRQLHHHGSIDDPDLLARYQAAVRGG